MAKETDLIKEKLDLVEFLRSYLSLIPAGKNFKALCPFHSEKTPSFFVTPERKMWHCFGCGAGGDIFKFLMRYENIEFPEALRVLAEKAGIPLARISPQEQREFGVLYDLHEAAKEFYKESLKKNAEATSYLRARGLKDDTIEEFELGFAPGGESLVLHLLRLKYDIADVVRAGLAYKNTYGLYRDRFDRRLMFPLMSAVGKTVAFTGRVLESESSSERPKYLNSQETPIFNKSRVLYGFHKSKNEIAREKAVLIVEGQMDFLMAWQDRVRNTIAISGTGLTAQHLERLRRLADTAYVSFDNDAAGMKALERALDLLHAFDFHVKALSLGGYKDPADAVLAKPGFLGQALRTAKPAFTYLLEHAFSEDVARDVVEKKRAVKHFLGIIGRVKSAVEQHELVRELSRVSHVSEISLFEELAGFEEDAPKDEMEASVSDTHGKREERIANRLLLLSFANDLFLGILKAQKELLPESYRELIERPEAWSALLSGAESFSGEQDPQKLEDEFKDLLKQLKLISLVKRQQMLKEKLRMAEEWGEAEFAQAAEEFNSLSKEINMLKLE